MIDTPASVIIYPPNNAAGGWDACFVALSLPSATLQDGNITPLNVRSEYRIDAPTLFFFGHPAGTALTLTWQLAALSPRLPMTNTVTLNIGDDIDAAVVRLGPTTATVGRQALADDPAFRSRYLTSGARSFRNRLASGFGPTTITLCSDSTADETTDWFYLFLASLAAKYPAYTVDYRLWNDTNQAYVAPLRMQTGTAGSSYVIPAASSSLTTADSAGVSLATTDFMIRAKVRLPSSLTPATTCTLACQEGGAGNRSWRVRLTTGGDLILRISADGTNVQDLTFISAATMAANFTAGTDVYIGLTFLRTNGSNCVAQAIKSTDGTVWTTLGSAATGTIVAGLFDSTANPEVGTFSTIEPWLGRIYWVEVYKGVVGTSPLAWRFDPSWWISGLSGATWVDADGLTWTRSGSGITLTTLAPLLTVLNGAMPGQGLSYFDDNTRRPKMVKAVSDVLIVSTGHNEAAADLSSAYTTFITNALAISAGQQVVLSTQNPKSSDQATYRLQNFNQNKVRQIAGAKGWPVIDAFQAFIDSGVPDTLVSDGTHPNATGSALWAATAVATFGVS